MQISTPHPNWRNALQSVASIPSLRNAWHEILSHATKRSRRTIGVDGQSINDYALDLPRHLRFLSYELSDSSFQFQLLRPQPILKSNGKVRVICIPTVRDRIVQRALLEYLSKKYHQRFSNSISYGFVKGRTVTAAVDRSCSLRRVDRWVYKTDIQSFFDRIGRTLLRELIVRYIRDKTLHGLLWAAVNCEVDSSNRSMRQLLRTQGILPGEGVRQGMSLSPFFANLVLRDFDLAIESNNYKAIRYADDLIFFGASEDHCKELHEFCKDELLKCGLSIPPLDSSNDSKTRIFDPSEIADFLGLGISPAGQGYVAKVTPKQIEKMKTELLKLSNPTELVSRGIKLASFGAALENRVNGYIHAYEGCANASQVEHELSAIAERIKRTLFRDHLKIEINSLSPDARVFADI